MHDWLIFTYVLSKKKAKHQNTVFCSWHQTTKSQPILFFCWHLTTFNLRKRKTFILKTSPTTLFEAVESSTQRNKNIEKKKTKKESHMDACEVFFSREKKQNHASILCWNLRTWHSSLIKIICQCEENYSINTHTYIQGSGLHHHMLLLLFSTTFKITYNRTFTSLNLNILHWYRLVVI